MSLISTRVTLIPHGSEAASITVRKPRVDLVATRENLVEVHRVHERARVPTACGALSELPTHGSETTEDHIKLHRYVI